MASTAQQVGFAIAGMLKSDASINAAGTIEFYTSGGAFAVTKAAWSDSGKTTELDTSGGIHFATLDAAGKVTVYCDGTYDIKVKDADGNTVDTLLNMYFQVDDSEGIFTVKVITAATATLDAADDLVVINKSGACAIQLQAVVDGKRIVFKNMHASSGTTTVTRAGADTFDAVGTTTIAIIGPSDVHEIYGDSTNSRWHTVSQTNTIDPIAVTIGGTPASAITSIKDEDDMSSDIASALATQQSIKAYVDTTKEMRAKFSNHASADIITLGSFGYWHVGALGSGGIYSTSAINTAAYTAGTVASKFAYLTIDDSALTTATELATTSVLAWRQTIVVDTSIAFVDSDPDTITDSNNGLAGFMAGDSVRVQGTANNDGVYEIATSSAGTLTLVASVTLTAEGAGGSFTLEAVPTYNESAKGWYFGTDASDSDLAYDQCIFAAQENAGNTDFLDFNHDGGDLVGYDVAVVDRAKANLNTTWVDIILTAPGFCIKAHAQFNHSFGSGALSVGSYRVNGSGGTGIAVTEVAGANVTDTSLLPVFTDIAQTIEAKLSTTDDDTFGEQTVGWYFPRGM